MRHVFGRDYLYEKPYMAFMQGLVDSIGHLIIRRPGKREFDKAGISRILVARIDHLGDVFIAASILPHLKRAFPEARIDFMAGAWTQVYLRTNPSVDRIIVYNAFKHNRSAGFLKKARDAVLGYLSAIIEMRRASYDLCINLRTYSFNAATLLYLGNGGYTAGFATGGFGFLLDKIIPYRDGVHEAAHIADALAAVGAAISEAEVRPVFEPSITATAKAAELLIGLGIADGEPFALIHTGAGTPVKYWRGAAWSEVAGTLKKRDGLKIVATDPVHGGINGCIDLPALVSFDVYAAIAKKAALFIGLDSFPAHLAASMGTPTVVIWCGVNDPVRWRPLGARVVVVKKDVECAPCYKKSGCADMVCMKISAADCLDAVAVFLKK